MQPPTGVNALRVIDLYLKKKEADEIREAAAESGHRIISEQESELEHVRVVVSQGSPDDLLELVRDKVETSDTDDDFYVVLEPVAVAPRDADQDAEEARAATDEIESFIADGARFTRTFGSLAAVSGILATAGLLRDSPAVLVGAMVIAPLFKPMASAGAGIVLGRLRECLLGLGLLWVALLTAAVAGFVVTLITPDAEATPAVILRSDISFFDLVIALASGTAMAYTLLKRDAMAMIGIVVAASLVPVASTLGVALAISRFDLVGGAFVTLLSNVAGILVSLTLVCRIELARRRYTGSDTDPERLSTRGLWIGGSLLVLLLVINIWDDFWRGGTEATPREPRTALIELAPTMPGIVSVAPITNGPLLVVVSDDVSQDELRQIEHGLAAALAVSVTDLSDHVLVIESSSTMHRTDRRPQ
ncbi:MAG: DUF389 domain-containing protein [Planctomycetota bacterium]